PLRAGGVAATPRRAGAAPPGQRTPPPAERTPPARPRPGPRRPRPGPPPGQTPGRPLLQGAPQATAQAPRAQSRVCPRPPLAPRPEAVDQVLEAPLPEACPHCGGSVVETEVKPQYQTEIPRRPLVRQFNVHIGSGAGCGRRLQGRHPLQTSD